MKWKKPGGALIETNDRPETVAYCEKIGWKPVKGSKKVTLFKRLEGELIEGDENPFDEVIIESEKFPESAVDGALKDGWFLTGEDAAHAPADPAPESASSGTVTTEVKK